MTTTVLWRRLARPPVFFGSRLCWVAVLLPSIVSFVSLRLSIPVFLRHFGLSCLARIFVPCLSVSWLSLFCLYAFVSYVSGLCLYDSLGFCVPFLLIVSLSLCVLSVCLMSLFPYTFLYRNRTNTLAITPPLGRILELV